MVTFETKITKLEVEPSLNGYTDYVVAVRVDITATNIETQKTETIRRCVRLGTSNEIINTEFVNYTDLTAEIVLGWVKLTKEYSRLIDKLNFKINPPVPFTPSVEIREELPWE